MIKRRNIDRSSIRRIHFRGDENWHTRRLTNTLRVHVKTIISDRWRVLFAVVSLLEGAIRSFIKGRSHDIFCAHVSLWSSLQGLEVPFNLFICCVKFRTNSRHIFLAFHRKKISLYRHVLVQNEWLKSHKTLFR